MKKNHKVYFENKDLPYTGVPFISSSCSTPDCQQEKDKNLKAKALYLKKKNEEAQLCILSDIQGYWLSLTLFRQNKNSNFLMSLLKSEISL